MENISATPALQERAPLFYRKNREKEDSQVVVYPLKPGLIKATRGAHPGLVVQFYCLGLYPGNKEEHGIIE